VGIAHAKSNVVGNWTGTVTVLNSQGSTATVAATDLVRPQDWNSAHNMLFTLSGNTSGQSTASGSNVVFAGGSNITLQGSTDTISIHGVAPQVTHTIFRAMHDVYTAAGTAQGNSIVSVQPFILPFPLAFSNVRCAASFSVATTTNNSSAFMDLSISGVVYTRNDSTLSSVYSFNNTMFQTWSSNATGTVTGVIGLTATGAGTTLSAGEYWLALHVSTTNTATGGASTTALNRTLSMILGMSVNSAANLMKPWGAQTNGSLGFHPGLGVISTGATLATLALSSVTCTGTRAIVAPVAFEMRNATFQS
jgi:hypothetical protein